MHRRLWLLAGTTATVLLLGASATAAHGSAARSTPAAAPFAESWARVPATAAARKAKDTLVFGMEQDIDGFNTTLTCCNEFWAAATGNTPVIRGAYNITNTLQHVTDLITSASATKTSLTLNIRPDANWNWGGRKLPVTYKDFVYTWQQIVNPDNDVISRNGYDQITGFTHKGQKQVTFTWKTPYADWQDLFGLVYPSAALAGTNFNTIWANCVCGNDGKPVSDGPFILTNYTKGQGLTLKANPFWYGQKPGLKEVDFRIITDTNTEVQAMRGGEVDAINPTFGSNLSPLKGQSGVTFSVVPGLYQEHIDIQFGQKGQPLLRSPWMRQAIMMGIDRQGIITTVYGPLAAGTKPLNSLLYYQSDEAYRPDFALWNFNPAKALALLKKHCTGGPATVSQSNSSIWTCAGLPAKFRFTWTSSNATRTTQEAIIKQELKSIGIEIDDASLPANVVFGPTGIPSSNYDLADFAWVTAPDPAGFVTTWSCGGLQNYLNYCNRKATALLNASQSELNPAKRAIDFQQADALMAKDVPSIPMYSRPNPLIYKSSILGMKNNPSNVGFAWNIEQWKWKS
ncbi:MAG TPA: peptide ABC transporter substrate-binding protein [Gaiellaceae bacterium]|nr:peptide ABC transporter substrate-binding protein [Gaiellaceae bacterium]